MEIRPKVTSFSCNQCESENSLVMSWLINSMQPQIARGFFRSINTSAQNGVFELKNRHLLEIAQALVFTMKYEPSYTFLGGCFVYNLLDQ